MVGAVVTDGVYLGSMRRYELSLPDGARLTARVPMTEAAAPFEAGQQVQIRWRPEDAVVVTDRGAPGDPLADADPQAGNGAAPTAQALDAGPRAAAPRR